MQRIVIIVLLSLAANPQKSNGFNCSDGSSIKDELTCDSRKDCLDGEDEAVDLCSHHECSQRCEHFCSHNRNGSSCACRPGYQLVDGFRCTLQDPCVARGCSHSCFESTEGTQCLCSLGFKITNQTHCLLSSGEYSPTVMIASGRQILKFEPERRSLSTKFESSDDDVWSFDIDIENGPLYFVVGHHEGNEIQIQTSIMDPYSRYPRRILTKIPFELVYDIRLDWITRNLYVMGMKGGRMAIVVCRIDRELCIEVVGNIAGDTGMLTLDPRRARMYWVASTTNSSTIFSASMDGSEVKKLSDNIGKIVGFNIDVFANRLYWIDLTDRRISFMSLDGKGVGHLRALSTVGTPSSLAIFGDSVYWTELGDDMSSRVFSCDKLTGENITLVIRREGINSTTTGLMVFQSFMQRGRSNPCERQQCSHICTLTETLADYTCLCPPGETLWSKNRCHGSEDSYLVATASQLYRVPARKVNDLAQDYEMQVPHIVAMTHDPNYNELYVITNQGKHSLAKISLRGDFRVTVLRGLHVDFVTMVEFDPINRLLYWFDPYKYVVVMYNPARNETTRIRVGGQCSASTSTHEEPVDFSVDYAKGLIYVLVYGVSNHHSAASRIDIYSVRGTRIASTRNIANMKEIAVELVSGSVVALNAARNSILTVGGNTTAELLHDVQEGHQLAYWNGHLTWRQRKQPGFFIRDIFTGVTDHVTKTPWTEHTIALCYARKPGDQERTTSACSRNNAGCSHTCLMAGSETVCICPDGMELNSNKRTCQQLPKATCKSDEFTCTNGYQCIPLGMICNGGGDCDDRSDESKSVCGDYNN